MLISKKSPRESKLFNSQFRNGSGTDFSLRKFQRCQEELSSNMVHLVLLAAFSVLLILFGRSVWHLFAHHGQGLNSWYRPAVMGVIGVMVGSVLLRVWKKYLEIKLIKKEIAFYRDEIRKSKISDLSEINPQ